MIEQKEPETLHSLTPPLHGLLLAGGASRRMGCDKGALIVKGEPQARRAFRLLESVCGRAYVAVNARSAAVEPYASLPLIVDDGDYRGPAAGLEAAWARHPGAAWLMLAVDMPLVDGALLEALVAARDRAAVATVFRHADGTLEPLCAIWEPTARDALAQQLAGKDASLRRLLERHRVAGIRPDAPEKLRGGNDPAAFAALIAALGGD
jgi:molybdenum cofactor guanylyltransferase